MSGPAQAPKPQQNQRLTVNVADLRRRLGQRRVLEIDLRLPPLQVVASRSTEDPVTGSLTIESIERGVTLRGSVKFNWEGECRRCLDAVNGSSEVDVMEIFQVGAAADSDEISVLEEDTVDLVPIVRDAVLVGLPLAPLCDGDCIGPDPDRYPTGSGESERPSQKKPDPRWDALSELKLD